MFVFSYYSTFISEWHTGYKANVYLTSIVSEPERDVHLYFSFEIAYNQLAYGICPVIHGSLNMYHYSNLPDTLTTILSQTSLRNMVWLPPFSRQITRTERPEPAWKDSLSIVPEGVRDIGCDYQPAIWCASLNLLLLAIPPRNISHLWESLLNSPSHSRQGHWRNQSCCIGEES